MNRIEHGRAYRMAAEPWFEPPPLVAGQGRGHAACFDRWLSLRAGRRCPDIADFRRHASTGRAAGSVLVALARGEAPPRLLDVAVDVAEHGGLDPQCPDLAGLPRTTLLVQLVRRLHKVRDFGGPLQFEADYPDREGRATHYAGVLLPFADASGEIAFVQISVEWRRVVEADVDTSAAIALALRLSGLGQEPALWDKQPVGAASDPPTPQDLLRTARTWAALSLEGSAVRETSLHAALGATYDLLLAAEGDPACLCRLSDEPSAPWRSPTAIAIRLVFGAATARKERAAHAAVLAHARRLRLGRGQLGRVLKEIESGTAMLAAAERQARRAERAPVPVERTPSTASEIAFAPVDGSLFPARMRREPAGSQPVERSLATPFGRLAG